VRAVTLIVVAAAAGLHACSPATDEPAGVDTHLLPAGVGLIVVESRYDGTGYLQAIDAHTHGVVDQYGTAYDQDPQLRRWVDPRDSTERIFIVGSTDGFLTQIDRRGHVVARYDVKDASGDYVDPLDVAIAPDGSLWVTRYKSASILVLEPDGTKRTVVPLDAFTPANATKTRTPTMSAISIVHGVAYVALRRLDDDSNPTNVSQIISIDTTATPYQPKAWVDLPVPDPDDHFTLSLDDPPKLRITCIGGPLSTPPIPGAIVELDLAASPPTVRVVADGRTTGDFFNAFDVAPDGHWYVVTASESSRDNPTALQPFDPATGQLDAPWFSKSLYMRGLWQVAVVGDFLLVADRDPASPGIDVFDRTDGAHLGEIATELPPVEFVVVRDQTQP